MPNITFDGPQLSQEQKKNIIEEFTAKASQITKIPEEAFVVTIKENKMENVGVGGQVLSEKMSDNN